MAAHLLAGTAMSLRDYWTSRLQHIGAQLQAEGQHGYAAELAAIARYIEMLQRSLDSQRAVSEQLVQRYADWTPPGKVYRAAPYVPRTKGDM
jgi:hypothetical protein